MDRSGTRIPPGGFGEWMTSPISPTSRSLLRGRARGPARSVGALVLAAAWSACGEPAGPEVRFGPNPQLVCELDERWLADGQVGRDGIPALSDPLFLPAEPRVDETSYFLPSDRVIALWSAGEWLVIPHNIMWRHEIVNLTETAVTYCPLTGSAMAFARSSVDGAEFGVSGLLYQANLIMYDRNGADESFWPQMYGEARCGPRTGQPLTRVPVVEMTWEGWIELEPDSKVLALTPEMGDPALYFQNPYGDGYDAPYNPDYLGFPLPLDGRRPPKERVLGIPDGVGGGMAFPFLEMDAAGDLAVFPFELDGEPAVVLWDARRGSAMAYRTTVDGDPATFEVVGEGFVDSVSGSTWAVHGRPIAGPFAETSRRLRPITEAYVAFWAAWAAFHPETTLALGR